MLSDLSLFGFGAATVIDTVLVLALIERPNRRQIAVWMLWLTGAAWLWHAGSFAHTLLQEAEHSWPLRLNSLAMITMAAGLLMMPSAMLHGAIRLWHTGIEPKPVADIRYGLCYLPVLALGPIARVLWDRPRGDFLSLVAEFTVPFVVWLCATNLFAAVTFAGLRGRLALPRAGQFLLSMALMLCGLSVLVVFGVFVALSRWPQQAELWKLGISLSPVVPALLFAYFVMRFGFVPLVLERSLVYGAVLAAAFLFHHLAVRDVTNRLTEQLRVDFALVEAAVAVGLILLYQPLRQRVAEALRYLLGSRVADVREETRRLSARLTELTDQPLEQAIAGVSAEMQKLFDVDRVVIELFSDSPTNPKRERGSEPHEARDPVQAGASPTIENSGIGGALALADASGYLGDACWLHQRLTATAQRLATRRDAPSHEVSTWLTTNGCSAAMAFEHHEVRGLILLGRKRLNQNLSAEELNAFALLTEQFAITLHNARLQQDRLTAERRALRQEKLSVLGLLASSIAHEIKNPLSSIRTIATVMREDLGSESSHAEDLRLIVSEIDRLAASTRQLLEFARPAPENGDACDVREVVERTLKVLRHLASQRGVRLTAELGETAAPVRADAASLSEIIFNLLSNAIDAAGCDGEVSVSCRQDANSVTLLVRDTGPGLAPEIQNHLFQPFTTTKLDGTGLGLYIVARRVRELGAEIRCESAAGKGTSFEVRLGK